MEHIGDAGVSVQARHILFSDFIQSHVFGASITVLENILYIHWERKHYILLNIINIQENVLLSL